MRLLILLGFAAVLSGFGIITFITLSLFFKKQICFHERNKLILAFELLLDFCGWIFLGALIGVLFLGGNF